MLFGMGKPLPGTRQLSRFFVCSLLSLLPPPRCLGAQTDTGTLLGTVRQESSASVRTAGVTFHRRATNETSTVLTNQRGDYRRDGLPIGAWIS